MSQKKFKYPLAITGDWQSLIDDLEALGYTFIGLNVLNLGGILVTNFSGENGVCTDLIRDNGRYNRIIVDASNRELVLALAAAVENEEGNKGEWYVFTGGGLSSFKGGALYKLVKERVTDSFAFVDENGVEDGWSTGNIKYFRKATEEELFKHFQINYEPSNTLVSADFEKPIETHVPVRIEFIKRLHSAFKEEDEVEREWKEKLEEEVPSLFPPRPTFHLGQTLYLKEASCLPKALMIVGTANNNATGFTRIALVDLSSGQVKSETVGVDDPQNITERELLEAGKGFGLTRSNYTV